MITDWGASLERLARLLGGLRPRPARCPGGSEMRLESSVPFTPLEVPKKEQENNERVNEADPTPFPRRRHDWRKGVPALNLEDSGSNPGRQFESSWI